MIESILESIKRPLGLNEEDTSFDAEIEMHINGVFSVLNQIGVAPVDNFMIDGKTTKWSDFLLDRQNVNMVQSYMFLQVQLIFDPPSTSFAIESKQKLIDQLVWRMQSLELAFNPDAWMSPAPDAVEEPLVWEIDERDPLPVEMEKGEVAFDPVTGNAIRKI
jgi:hypothetical protein